MWISETNYRGGLVNMKMILEFNTIEAKNAVVSGALLGMLEVMADFEKANEAPARNFTEKLNAQQPTAQSQQTAPAPAPIQQLAAPMPNEVLTSQQPIYPSTMPDTVQQPQPPTGPIQQQMQSQALAQQPAAPSVVPTSQAPTFTMDQLAVAATTLVDAGKIDQLRGILSSFGVTALTELPKERYGEFATVLRKNGVKI